MNHTYLPPDAPTLIESTRAIGYTLEAAVSDIIDNSISASSTSVDIFFFPIGDPHIAILDDGCGMDSKELETAMRYGSRNPQEKRASNDLGRFGLGLKTASLSQCRSLTVASKKGGQIVARCWDIDYVIKEGDWYVKKLETSEIDSLPHIEKLKEINSGTLVVWQNLDRLKMGELDFDRSMGRKMDEVRSHISLVFHRFITGEPDLKKVRININGRPIVAVDPFLVTRNTQVMSDEKIPIEGAAIVVKPYILPHLSNLSEKEKGAIGGKDGLRKNQGFYIYRNKRLLIGGTWFRMMRQGELSKLARVQVDVPSEMDHLWTLDIKKSTAVPPEVVRIHLQSVIERLAEKSKYTWEFRGKQEIDDSLTHVWTRFKGKEGGHYYGINRNHPLVRIFDEAPPQMRQNLESLLKNVETNLPLNQLYLDLNSDLRIENEITSTAQEVEEVLRGLLDQKNNSTARSELLERLAISDPFVHFPELLEKYRGETNNGHD